MKRSALFVLLLTLVLVATGCEEMRLRSQVRKLMASTVVLPEKVIRIAGEEMLPMPDSLREKAKLIIYIDSLECRSCRFSKIPMYERIIPSAESYGVAVMIMMANRTYSGITLAQYLSDIDLGVPIYVDEESVFLSMNSAIPADTRLHSFLVNRQGTPVLIGDPVLSPGIAELFERMLRQGI